MKYIDNLNQIRYEKNISFRQLSILCDLSESSVKNVLYKKNAPLVPSLEKICVALDISITEIFCNNDEIVLNKSNPLFSLAYAYSSLPMDIQNLFLQLITSYSKK